MTNEAEATIYRHTKGKTLYVSIASKMAQDSHFPFVEGQKVKIRISMVGKKLIIEETDEA